MESVIRLTKLKFTPNSRGDEARKVAIVWLLLFTMLTGMFVVYAEVAEIPVTGFEQFDAMYHMHMSEKDSPLLEDMVNPVNDLVFFLIKLQMRVLGSFLLLLLVTTIAFAVWYAAKPDFAEEVSEVKMRVANGEKIPFDEPADFVMQFCPDIKANSGISDSYEYERPTIGLLMRDHLLKFVILFAIAIALSTNVITSFVVKAGYALASGAKYYTDTTDFVGIVNTVTTAGKDYKPRYNTMTTEGRNKQKTFNAMYTTLKDVDKRNRTQDYLDQLGTAVNKRVLALGETTETGGNKLDYSLPNFTANADIVSYETTVDNSPTKSVVQMKTSDFIPGEESTMYLTVFQYEEAPEDGKSRYTPTTYKNSWNTSGSGYPTSIDIHKSFNADLTQSGYKFEKKGANGTKAILKTNKGKTLKLTVDVKVTESTLTVSFPDISTKIGEITKDDKADGLKSIEITGLSKHVVLKNGTGNTKQLENPIKWTAK